MLEPQPLPGQPTQPRGEDSEGGDKDDDLLEVESVLPKLVLNPFNSSDFPPTHVGERHPVLESFLRQWLQMEGSNATAVGGQSAIVNTSLTSAEHSGSTNISGVATQPRRQEARKIIISLRDEEPPPSPEMHEAARAAFDSTGALMAADFEGRPLRSRCWVATQPIQLAAGKANCAMSADGDKCLQCWPSWFLIGAPKAGTTVLWQSLRHHPQIVPRGGKELHYWDGQWPSNGGGESMARTERYTDDAGGDYMRHLRAAKAGGLLGLAFGGEVGNMSMQERSTLPFLIGDGDPNYLYSSMRFPWDTSTTDEESSALAEGVDADAAAGAGRRAAKWTNRSTFSTAQVMRAVLPDARLVVILREPGARALSHMRMTCEAACRREHNGTVINNRAHRLDMQRCIRCPVDAEQWAEIVDREIGDLNALCTGAEALAAGATADVLADDCFAPHALHAPGGHRLAFRAMSTGTWVGRSIYFHWLLDWLNHWPRDQVHIIRYEDWVAAPEQVTHGALEFLGVRHWPGLGAHTPKPREATQGDDVHASTPVTRAKLRAFYAPFNARLAALLGDDRWLWEDSVGG